MVKLYKIIFLCKTGFNNMQRILKKKNINTAQAPVTEVYKCACGGKIPCTSRHHQPSIRDGI